MRRSMRVLLCAPEDWPNPLLTEPSPGSGVEWVGPFSSGGAALVEHRIGTTDGIVVIGDVDGCHGARLSKVLNLEREVPTLIVCEDGEQKAARQAADARGGWQIQICGASELSHNRIHELLGYTPVPAEGSSLNVVTLPVAAPPRVAGIARELMDAVVLLGSAGTPNMLPEILRPSRLPRAPLVIAVHHNPRWSDAFADWIAQLSGRAVKPWRFGALASDATYVVRSEEDGGGALRPDLGDLVRSLCAGRRRILAMLASGMGASDVEAWIEVKRSGGIVVALRPELCAQPMMVEAAIEAGAVDAQLSIEDLAWLIERVQGVHRSRTAVHK